MESACTHNEEKNMKKVLSLILALAMVVSMTACGGAGSKENLSGESLAEILTAAVEQTGKLLYEGTKEPTLGSLGGEWMILGLARSGLEIPDEYYETYFQNASAYTAGVGGELHAKKYTEYSRVILAMTAIGKDPTDVGGYNLLIPLANFEQTVFQGINGPAFALIALDSGNYDIPENTAGTTQATRDIYVDYIINAQLENGGWSLMGGEVELDVTAMALQALAKYRDRKDVAEAIDKALVILSQQQNENGGYTSYDEECSESISQTIVALCELGISLEDDRFVKNGNTLVDGLLRFRLEDGSFSHMLDDSSDLLATEQAFYALVAASRTLKGESSLYNMK